jgi:gluconolactonase
MKKSERLRPIVGAMLLALCIGVGSTIPAAVRAQNGPPAGPVSVGGRILGLQQICDDCTAEKFTSECPGRLEGPNFDRAGNLWMVGITPGDIYRVTPDGHCSAVAHTPAPVGLRIHKDGRIFGVDHERGLFSVDPTSLAVTYIANQWNRETFRGLDDLFFDKTGGLYMTDAYGSSALEPVGQLFYRSADGQISRLISSNLAFPNGVVLSLDEQTLYVDDWGTNRILAIPVTSPGHINLEFAYVFAYLNGGHGPDSMTADAQGNIYAAHYAAGEVVVFDPRGNYFGAIRLPPGAGYLTTNVALHDGYLYITEADQHTVWRVKTKIPSRPLYADQ